jgi:hypothetical protein
MFAIVRNSPQQQSFRERNLKELEHRYWFGGWSKKHRAQWPSSMKRYAYPPIGALSIAEIRPSHIFDLQERTSPARSVMSIVKSAIYRK